MWPISDSSVNWTLSQTDQHAQKNNNKMAQYACNTKLNMAEFINWCTMEAKEFEDEDEEKESKVVFFACMELLL